MLIMPHPTLNLSGFTFSELFHSKGLYRLDEAFLATLDPALCRHLLAYREGKSTFSALETSELLLAVAQPLEDFLLQLFDIEEAAAEVSAKTLAHNPISAFKQYFVLRRAKKNILKSD